MNKKRIYTGRKWNEWGLGERMSKGDVLKSLNELSEEILKGGSDRWRMGIALRIISYNIQIILEPGNELEDFERIYAQKKILEEYPYREFTSEEIKAIRDKTGLSQIAFAEALGVSRDAVNSWEIGRRKPPIEENKTLQLLDWEVVSLD